MLEDKNLKPERTKKNTATRRTDYVEVVKLLFAYVSLLYISLSSKHGQTAT